MGAAVSPPHSTSVLVELPTSVDGPAGLMLPNAERSPLRPKLCQPSTSSSYGEARSGTATPREVL